MICRHSAVCALPGLLLLATVRTAAADDVPDGVYAEAAQTYGVPESLLRAMADVESGGHMNRLPTRDGRWGPMGLVAGRTLERAAARTGFDAQTLTTDVRANVLGGAAALAELAASSGSLQETLFRWAGFDVPTASWEYASEVIARLGPMDEYVHAAFPGGPGYLPDDDYDAPPPRPRVEATPDYPEARWVGPACSYTNASRTTLEFVVIHTCEGGFSGCWSWLVGCHDVSAHYVVSEAGEVVQCVEDADTAWHVGCLNSRSIGIEHAGSATRPEDFTDAMYCASARLTRWLCDHHGVPRDRDHIIGHNEANDLYCGGTHWDPGPGWDWAKYMDYVECGCGGCTPTRPVLDLRVETDVIPDQPPDVCTLHESEGVFDLWSGQTTVQRFYVANVGDAVGRHVTVGLWVEEPFLRLRHWDIYDNWPAHTCGADWCLNDANDDPANPAHDDPGAALILHLSSLSPGETKRIDLTVEAGEFSLGLADHPDIRLWVQHVDDFYEKADFWSTDFNNVGGYQTFNGGDLRIWSQTDVLRPETCDGVDDDCDGVTDEDCVAEGEDDVGADGSRDVVPVLDVPRTDASAGVDGAGDGCGCRATGAPRGLFALLALLLGAAFAGRGRGIAAPGTTVPRGAPSAAAGGAQPASTRSAPRTSDVRCGRTNASEMTSEPSANAARNGIARK